MSADTLSRFLADSPAAGTDRTAFVAGEERVSYAQFQDAAARLAGALVDSMGFEPGDRLGILLPNCPQFAIAYFGAHHAGAVALPLNPLFAPAELVAILVESRPKAVVTLPQLVPALVAAREAGAPIGSILVTLGEVPEGSDATPFETVVAAGSPRDPHDADPSSMAVLLYSSGTTGVPKGIMLSHRNLISNTASVRAFKKWGDDEVFLTVLPLFHGYASLAMMMLPLSLGATIALESRFVPSRILERIGEHRVTFFAGVPPMYALFLRKCNPADYELASCRHWLSGAAPLPMALFDAFRDRFGVEIVEGYGPQECSPVISANPLTEPVHPGTVGPIVRDVEVRIVAPDGRDLPVGQDGEVVARGPNVMLGYYQKPEDTAEVLRDGWYHTGDMGRMDEDGFLSITGRIKEMIIVKGENVYPAEVEQVLLTHPAVADVAVKGMKEEIRGEKVVAFVVVKEGIETTERELIDHCTAGLADFKVPRDIRFLDAIPRNPAGKILRRTLPDE